MGARLVHRQTRHHLASSSTVTLTGAGGGQESNPLTATLTAIPRSAVPNPNGTLDSVREGNPASTGTATAQATAQATATATTPLSAESAGSGPTHAPAPGGGEEGEEIGFGNEARE